MIFFLSDTHSLLSKEKRASVARRIHKPVNLGIQQQAVNMNEPTKRTLQARTIGCNNFVCYCPFYRQLHCQDSARNHRFYSQIDRLKGPPQDSVEFEREKCGSS